MKKKKPYQWKSPYGPLLVQLFGTIIGLGLLHFFVKELNYDVIIGPSIVFIIYFLIIYRKKKKKKENVPEIDERVINNMFRFYSCTAHAFIMILFLFLAILTLLKIETIPIMYVWIFGFIYMAITGIGNLYIKNH